MLGILLAFIPGQDQAQFFSQSLPYEAGWWSLSKLLAKANNRKRNGHWQGGSSYIPDTFPDRPVQRPAEDAEDKGRDPDRPKLLLFGNTSYCSYSFVPPGGKGQ